LGYRNKVELSFGRNPATGRLLGYHRLDEPSSLVDIESCAIAVPRLQPLLDASREFFLRGPGTSDPALDDPRERVRLVLRESGARDERPRRHPGARRAVSNASRFRACSLRCGRLVSRVWCG
jgi:hypothetical protein